MNQYISKLGFKFGIAAFVANIGFVLAQTLQLLKILKYPFDEIFIYGFSLCIVIPFLLAMLALHYFSPDDKKYWSHAALIFTIIYSFFVIANYVVQLATVIPMTIKGNANQISLLIQTPHSLFWDFDAIGYIAMGIAMLLAIPVFKKVLSHTVCKRCLKEALYSYQIIKTQAKIFIIGGAQCYNQSICMQRIIATTICNSVVMKKLYRGIKIRYEQWYTGH